MTVRGVIFDLGSTLMYFDGDWEDVISRGVADMLAFFRGKRVKLDEGALAELLRGWGADVVHVNCLPHVHGARAARRAGRSVTPFFPARSHP